MKEKIKHKEAFEFFLSIGGMASDKNVRKVAENWQVSERTIWRWYKKYNWKERVEQRNIENGKKLEQKVDKVIVQSKANYRALISKVVKKFEEKLKGGKIRIERPEDLNIMAKLDLLLMGENPEDKNLEINVTINKVGEK